MQGLVWDSEALHPKKANEPWPEYRRRAGISAACTIDLESGLPTFYAASDHNGNSIGCLAYRLEHAPLVVSFNGKGYDNIVMGGCLGRYFEPRNEVDIYAKIKEALAGEYWGKGSWTLSRLGKDLLGVGKVDDGAFAPSLWSGHEMGRLFTYLYRDVWLTWKVYEFGLENGYVLDPAGGKVEVRW